MAPRFSVVVPALNEADGLGATLASLARQRVDGGVEVIVVDNGSTDATAAIAAAAGARVVHEPRPGVCAARQRGVDVARGSWIVSTDADTVHPSDWLDRIDRRLRARPDAIAVAGPCRYLDPPWWAGVFPPAWFAGIAVLHRLTGRVLYLTATNAAFRRDGFPGYDTSLTQGGDEVDLLRRLRRWGPVVWDAGNPVGTSSRRMELGLLHTLVVSYGYHYALAHLVNRGTGRRVIGVAPTIRSQDRAAVRRRRHGVRVGLALVAGLALARRLRRSRRTRRVHGGPPLAWTDRCPPS